MWARWWDCLSAECTYTCPWSDRLTLTQSLSVSVIDYLSNLEFSSIRIVGDVRLARVSSQRGPRPRHLQELRARGKSVLVAGDLNCAYTDRDVFEPNKHRKQAGFTNEVCKNARECWLVMNVVRKCMLVISPRLPQSPNRLKNCWSADGVSKPSITRTGTRVVWAAPCRWLCGLLPRAPSKARWCMSS